MLIDAATEDARLREVVAARFADDGGLGQVRAIDAAAARRVGPAEGVEVESTARLARTLAAVVAIEARVEAGAGLSRADGAVAAGAQVKLLAGAIGRWRSKEKATRLVEPIAAPIAADVEHGSMIA